MKIIVLIMLIAFSASAQHDEVDGYIDLSVVQEVIVNGSDVSGAVSSLKGIVPQILSVQKNKGGSQTVDCSGVLIATDIVLTAAHCFEKEQNPFSVSVQLGKYAYLAHSIVRHPLFSQISFLPFGKGHQISGFNDIALVFLQRHVKGIKPALLPAARSRIRDGAPLIIVGFGKTSKNGMKTKKLKWVEAPASEQNSRIVVRGSKVSCKGDSGGPALSRYQGRYVARGVTSAGDCETYAYYTRVSAYVPWILDEIRRYRATDEI